MARGSRRSGYAPAKSSDKGGDSRSPRSPRGSPQGASSATASRSGTDSTERGLNDPGRDDVARLPEVGFARMPPTTADPSDDEDGEGDSQARYFETQGFKAAGNLKTTGESSDDSDGDDDPIEQIFADPSPTRVKGDADLSSTRVKGDAVPSPPRGMDDELFSDLIERPSPSERMKRYTRSLQMVENDVPTRASPEPVHQPANRPTGKARDGWITGNPRTDARETFKRVLRMRSVVANALCEQGLWEAEFLRTYDSDALKSRMSERVQWTIAEEINFLRLCGWLQQVAPTNAIVADFTAEDLESCTTRQITSIVSSPRDKAPLGTLIKFNGSFANWYDFRTTFECYITSMSPEYKSVLHHDRRRYTLADPLDHDAVLGAGIRDTQWLYTCPNNSQMRSERVYYALQQQCLGGSAAEYLNLGDIRDTRNGRHAWIRLCHAYETKQNQDALVAKAMSLMKNAVYNGSGKFTFEKYVSLHQQAHFLSARHEGSTVMSLTDKQNLLLDGIKDSEWKALIAATRVNTQVHFPTFDSLISHLSAEGTRIESAKKASTEAARTARLTRQKDGDGSNTRGDGSNTRRRGKRKGKGNGDGGHEKEKGDGGSNKRKRDDTSATTKIVNRLDPEVWKALGPDIQKQITTASATVRQSRKAKAARTQEDANTNDQSTHGYTASTSSEVYTTIVDTPSTSTLVEASKRATSLKTSETPSRKKTAPSKGKVTFASVKVKIDDANYKHLFH